MTRRTVLDTIERFELHGVSSGEADCAPRITGKHMHILSTIAMSDAGMTCREVEAKLGLLHQTASARIRELVLSGNIKDSGLRRAAQGGGPARVYMAQCQPTISAT